jgi:ferrous iron transport protein B
MKSTLFKGDGEVYLMELPPYRVPTLRSLLLHMWDRGRMYLQKAGTIILATSVILYICNTYPEKKDFSKDYEGEIAKIEESQLLTDAQVAVLEAAAQTEALAEIFGEDVMKEIKENKVVPDEALEALGELAEENEEFKLAEEVQAVVDAAQERADAIAALENEQMAEAMEYTISGRVGHALEPLFRPIGFDWKLTTASIGALAAKEVFVAQLGILYSEGEADEESVPLREQLRENYTPLQGICIMLFCLLSIPCLATLAIIRRELNSWSMPFIEAGGLLALAYIMTMIVYQVGSVLHIGTTMLGS